MVHSIYLKSRNVELEMIQFQVRKLTRPMPSVLLASALFADTSWFNETKTSLKRYQDHVTYSFNSW